MAAPTQITVSVDSTEYCRYENALDTITATVVVQGGAVYTDEVVQVDLIKARRSRDAVVACVNLTFNGPGDPQEGTAQFFLPDIVDQDLLSLVRHGSYFVRATSLTNAVTADSDDFKLRIISVAKLKSDYLFGINLTATEIKAPKFQPQAITGVSIVELSPTHPLGFGTLQYNVSTDDIANATVDVGSGTDGTVTITADNNEAGAAGNANAVAVVIPAGTSILSASFADGILAISLDVTAGVPNAAANTATLVAAAVSTLADFSAAASGTGADSLTAAQALTAFTGGLTNTIRTISWNGGALTTLGSTGTFVVRRGESGPKANLVGLQGGDFICVRVSSTALLPTTNVSEEILIDKQKMDDDTLCDYINRSVDWMENIVLAGFIEPTNVVTDRDPTTIQFAAGVNAPTPIFTDTDFDFIVSPLTYFTPKSSEWIFIQTQFPQVLRVDSLFGAIANTRVIDIDLEWIEVAQQSGMLELVPFNQEIAFDFIGLLWVNAIRGAAVLPNFWHFNMIVGLQEATGDIIEMIAKKAAIDALTVAGMALRPGIGSLSLSRDGVSESISYNQTAEYGLYTGTIKAYKDWMDDHIRELKGKYRGPTMVVV